VWQLPFALLPVLHFTSSRNEMGEFRNSALLSGNGLSGND
jgi:Mn2+/Fe2+ NRAMP family transporter